MENKCCLCKTVCLVNDCEACNKLYCDNCADQLLMFNEKNELIPWDGNQFLFCGCHLNPDPNKEFKNWRISDSEPNAYDDMINELMTNFICMDDIDDMNIILSSTLKNTLNTYVRLKIFKNE